MCQEKKKMQASLQIKTETPSINWAKHFTHALCATVPLARILGFKVQEMTPEKTICTLAGNSEGMNQNNTFQASTFYILADYAVGVAFIASLPEYSVYGVRDIPDGDLIQGWLKSGYVKHIRPATGEIKAVVEVRPEDRERFRRELEETGKTSYEGEAHIFQGIDLVAIAKHTVVFKKFVTTRQSH